MSGSGEVSADFAGEERAFRLRLGELRKIETRCETGIGEVCRRLARAVYVQNAAKGGDMLSALATGVEIHADDVRAPIYEGLVGAGMPSPEASKIVAAEIDHRGMRGLLDNAAVALLVLIGSQETPPGEPQAGESPATPPSPSTSDSSTASAPLSD
jgi:hypothetical protein